MGLFGKKKDTATKSSSISTSSLASLEREGDSTRASSTTTLSHRPKTSNGSKTSGSLKSPTSSSAKFEFPPVPNVPSSSHLPSYIPGINVPRAPDPRNDPVGYLRSIQSVRERASIIFGKAQLNQLRHFDVDMSKFEDTAAYVVSIIKRDYAPNYASIPPHGRWQHFDVGGRPRIDQLLASFPSTVSNNERCKRLIDLFVVSVLLDAGAGHTWTYKSKQNGKIYRRSEGLAVASLEMFITGMFSSDEANPFQVDGPALKRLTTEQLARGLQVSSTNSVAGLDGRAGLLVRLGTAMENATYFGSSQRPGNMLDFLLHHSSTLSSHANTPIVTIPHLWEVLMEGLAPVWPVSRTQLNAHSLGDAWPCSSLPSHSRSQEWESIAPFHKLTQWLTYSLLVPMQKLMNIHFVGVELLTGLPEYRNGGLLIDTGLLTLKKDDTERGLSAYAENAKRAGQPSVEVVPLFEAGDDVVVEWRSVTIGFLDALLKKVNRLLGLDATGKDGLTLAQMLEAGTWKGGREIAEVTRPNTKEPPIMIVSDGTVF